jgi:hypothetical protein
MNSRHFEDASMPLVSVLPTEAKRSFEARSPFEEIVVEDLMQIEVWLRDGYSKPQQAIAVHSATNCRH